MAHSSRLSVFGRVENKNNSVSCVLLHIIIFCTDNFPPTITAAVTFRINLRVEAVLTLLVTDPGDNFTLRLDGGLPENSTLEKVLEQEYIFRWILQQVTDRYLEFNATDTRGTTSTYMPRVEICACRNGGICTLTGVVSDEPTVVMNCQCSEGEF